MSGEDTLVEARNRVLVSTWSDVERFIILGEELFEWLRDGLALEGKTVYDTDVEMGKVSMYSVRIPAPSAAPTMESIGALAEAFTVKVREFVSDGRLVVGSRRCVEAYRDLDLSRGWLLSLQVERNTCTDSPSTAPKTEP